MISVKCTVCGTRCKARDDLAGKKVKCKHCGVVFSMPPAATEAADESERPAADNGTYSGPQLTIRDHLSRSLENISRRLADPHASPVLRLFRTKSNIIWLAAGGIVLLAVIARLLEWHFRGGFVEVLILLVVLLVGASLVISFMRPQNDLGERHRERSEIVTEERLRQAALAADEARSRERMRHAKVACPSCGSTQVQVNSPPQSRTGHDCLSTCCSLGLVPLLFDIAALIFAEQICICMACGRRFKPGKGALVRDQ